MENLEENLEKLPVEISIQAQTAEKARQKLDESKHILEIKEATEFITVKNEDTKKTVKEIDSQVVLNTEIEAGAVITAEGKFREEQIGLEKLVNLFNSTRKIANIKVAEMQSLKTTV